MCYIIGNNFCVFLINTIFAHLCMKIFKFLLLWRLWKWHVHLRWSKIKMVGAMWIERWSTNSLTDQGFSLGNRKVGISSRNCGIDIRVRIWVSYWKKYEVLIRRAKLVSEGKSKPVLQSGCLALRHCLLLSLSGN